MWQNRTQRSLRGFQNRYSAFSEPRPGLRQAPGVSHRDAKQRRALANDRLTPARRGRQEAKAAFSDAKRYIERLSEDQAVP